jgi:hypothetical protein
MHLVDGGVTKKVIELIFGYNKKNKNKDHRRWKILPPAELETFNASIDAWRNNTPYEFGRRVRNLNSFHLYKMVELRTLMNDFIIPLLISSPFKRELKLLANYIRGLRLISGSSYDPVNQV